MRKIKFRGYSPEEGRWFYGDLVTMYGSDEDVFIADWQDGEIHRVDPKSVGQFTECYDSDGKEIWEGDMLRVTDITGEVFTGHVEFGSGNFWFSWKKEGERHHIDLAYVYYFNKGIKVVGKVYKPRERMNTGG